MKHNRHTHDFTRIAALNRRGFLKAGAAVLAAGLSGKVFAAIPGAAAPERKLAFYNTHTGEQLQYTGLMAPIRRIASRKSIIFCVTTAPAKSAPSIPNC
jgi:hypothetical protein